ITDVAALLTDHGGQAAEIAGLVSDRDVEPTDMDRVGITVAPGHVEPALRALGKALERVAIDRMDRHASAGRHDADDAVPWKRVAAAGKMQCHAGYQTADRYRHLVAFGRTPRPRQRNDLGLDFLGVREGRVDDRASGGEPLANRHVKILDGDSVEVLEHGLERPLGKLLALLAERLLHDCPPKIEILGALLGSDKSANAGARLAGDDKPFPSRRGRLRLRRDDLNLVAVAQLGAQRNHPAVYFRSNAPVADLRVNRIGEINGRCAAWKRDQIAFRGKGEDLILEHLELGMLKKLLRPGSMVEDVQELAQPTVLRSFGRAGALLVGPMCGNAEFRDFVHFVTTDLHLDTLLLGPDDPGVQRAIIVRFGRRDEVFEPAGYDVIGRMDDAEG